ncbi:MAG: hypothetical protein GXP27_13160 [Planctomycetes bacterium]|nr:hypothetical protein [Planctomycetota bacterium]
MSVPAGGEAQCEFQIAAGRGTYSAHYPVHVYASFSEGGRQRVAHAVQVFLTELPPEQTTAASSAELPVIAVPEHGAVPLAASRQHRVLWRYFDQPLVRMPVGWEGSDPRCRASFHRGPVDRGQTREAIHMHPPWRPGGGTIFVEYRLKLPMAKPLRLTFYNAIRDHHPPKEPPSDGVTFRVWVDDVAVFERHTDSKRWVPGEVDLSPYAGRTIRLRLESHPGPKRNTTCDQSYWGDPVVVAGPPPTQLSSAEKRRLAAKAIQALQTGQADDKNVLVFDFEGPCRAAIALGPNGLADAAVAFGSPDRSVLFDGFRIAVEDQPVGRWPSGVLVERVSVRQAAAGRVLIEHHLQTKDGPSRLTAQVWTEGAGMRVKWDCPRRLTELALGPANQTAPRVYYGHGFCIVKPKAFRAYGGGHNLSTSHVGFDFERGVSLLMACDVPVDFLQVEPEQRLYTLRTHWNTTFTFVPGLQGAMDCAVRYRPLCEKRPSAGVARKAGRFCFDIWGGRYAVDAAGVRRCIDYGVTDALVVMHVWQRWGYDYRLPDIFPPDPRLGTLEELRAFSDLCARHDILFALHDNYIDFYPDATDFSYEHITFDAAGRPRKAWINTGRDAQSYQWRPDHIQPFVERNLKLIKPALRPTAYFIDVFTSANCFDYYDRQGTFHSKLETRRCWGQAFAWIRDFLGGQAPMISEAGGDHLIGYVDGADCQFLQIVSKPRRFCITIPCEDWARVPWFDAVHHTRFSLHGVGYSGRYQGGRSRSLHGIESDDYISAELLTGHALMVDRGANVRGAVRKYWLAQDFVRSIARDEIERVEWADGDLHRIIVHWKSGARVYVNRGPEDWDVEGRILPQYGYLAVNGAIESSIERIDGAVVERSRNGKTFYLNARGFVREPVLPIQPRAKRLEYLGNRRFKLLVDWLAERPAPKDLTVFMHFFQPQVSRLRLVGFYGGGGKPKVPTSRWQGRVTTGEDWTMTLPDDCPPGRYEILVGLYAPEERGRRYRLLGHEDSQRRYRIGVLVVEGKGRTVTGMRLEPIGPWPDASLADRLQPNRTPIDFGVAKTAGAFRCDLKADALVVTPLPDGPAFPVTLRLASIEKPAKGAAVRAIDVHGQPLREVPYQQSGSEVTFTTAPTEFGYRVELSPPGS